MMEVDQERRISAGRDFLTDPRSSSLILAAFFVLAALARVLRTGTLETDEMQQVLHYLTIEWGYGSQPPLYEWLQAAVFQFTGPSVTGLSVLKYGLLFLSTVLMTAAVSTQTRDRSAGLLAAFGLLSMPTVFLMSQRDLTHTVVAITCIALFFWSLFRAIANPSISNYLLVGIAIGLGTISKYNFVVIPAAAVIVLLAMKEFRGRVLDWRIVATLAAAAAIALPHALWLLQNLDVASAQTLDEMEIKEDLGRFWVFLATSASFITAVIKAALPILGFFFVLFARDVRTIVRASNPSTRLVGWTFVVSLVLVYLTVVAIGATEVRQKWLAIYFVALPLYLTLKIAAAGIDVRPRLKPAAVISGVLFLGVSAMLVGKDLVAPALGWSDKAEVPYAGLAVALEKELGKSPAAIVTLEPALAANLLLQFPTARIVLEKNGSLAPLATPAVFVATSDKASADLSGLRSDPATAPLQAIEVPDGPSTATKHVFYYSRL
jgi:4-amino-4-deoxy-L-arabinose transferase-like glycosyltransferase